LRSDFRRGELPDPVVVDGPPEPARFAELFELDSVARARYDVLYQRLMERTRADRDSVMVLRQRARDQDRVAARALRGLTARLAGQLKAFDDALRDALTKKQWKRYQHWREERREEAEEASRQR
jgi:hypothetical protein